MGQQVAVCPEGSIPSPFRQKASIIKGNNK